MSIPQRTLSGICEISTGTFTVTNLPPAFTCEVGALKVSISFTNGGTPYSVPTGTKAQMYLYYASRDQMTPAVDMAVSSATATGNLGIDDTAVAGCPLLVVQLVDTSSGTLTVACAVSMHIQRVRGEIRIHTSPPTPNEVVYVGRAPYIGINNHWMTWDNDTAQYRDSGVLSTGVGVASVCSKQPDADGNVQLAASDVKARPDTWMPTAAQVGAMARDAVRRIAFSLPVAAWSGSGPYTAAINDSAITAATEILDFVASGATRYNQPPTIEWETSAGKMTLSTATKPSGAIEGYMILAEVQA